MSLRRKFLVLTFLSIVFFLATARFMPEQIKDWSSSSSMQMLGNGAIVFLTITMTALPESLPFSIVTCLAYSQGKMLNDSLFVKNPQSILNYGYINHIIAGSG